MIEDYECCIAFDGSSRSQGGEATVVLYVLDRMVTQEGVNCVDYHFKVFLQNLIKQKWYFKFKCRQVKMIK